MRRTYLGLFGAPVKRYDLCRIFSGSLQDGILSLHISTQFVTPTSHWSPERGSQGSPIRAISDD